MRSRDIGNVWSRAEKYDKVRQSRDEGGGILSQDGKGQVSTWSEIRSSLAAGDRCFSFRVCLPWNLLSHVAANVWRSDSQCGIEHAETKDESIASPSGFVSPVHPYGSTVSICLTIDPWSNSANHHRDEPTSQAEKDTKSLHVVKPVVGEQDQETDDAVANDKATKDMPVLCNKFRMQGFKNCECL
jgi:hypothetical protein